MSQIPELDGPRLPAATGTADSLVVLAHGYGADGQDLIGLGQQWRPLLPGAAFVAPNAPQPCAMSPMGYQWWPIERRTPAEAAAGVEAAAPLFARFIEAELTRHGLPASRLALVGFSQGTMLSLHVGLRLTAAPACILGYSGMLVAPERLAPEIAVRPPVMLIHGEADDLIPPVASEMAAQALGSVEVPVQWHISPGIGHGIAPDGLQIGGAFLADSLSNRAATPA